MAEARSRNAKEPEHAALDFCIRLARAYAEAMRQIDARLSSIHGLSFSDFTILYHLKQAHGAKLRRIDLAERMGLTASAVTRSLLPLEKIGLVARQSDPRDARVGYACLTPAGERLFNDAIRTAESTCRDVLGASRDERDAGLGELFRRQQNKSL